MKTLPPSFLPPHSPLPPLLSTVLSTYAYKLHLRRHKKASALNLAGIRIFFHPLPLWKFNDWPVREFEASFV